MKINKLVKKAHQASIDKGWWEDQGFLSIYGHALKVVPEKLALIHSEVSEALEAWRSGYNITTIDAINNKPEGLPSELADVVIRVADLCGALQIDLEEEIRTKMKFNETRSHRHGGKLA